MNCRACGGVSKEGLQRPVCGLVVGLLFAAAVLPSAAAGAAERLRLPAVFSDHMVLQSGTAVPVWGRAAPGDSVTVTIASSGNDVPESSRTARAAADGRWIVRLDPLPAGEGRTLSFVTGAGETAIVRDVLVGEVWLCSGQSNMEMTMSGVEDAARETAAADLPRLRMFTVAHQSSPTPAEDCEGKWEVCSPGTVSRFSAVGFFFGRDLLAKIDKPVGMINASWGGTPIESWMSLDAVAKIPDRRAVAEALMRPVPSAWNAEEAAAVHRNALERWQEAKRLATEHNKKPPPEPQPPRDPRLGQDLPGNLFNGMIAPLVPYALRGAIWYQGEANAVRPGAALYRKQLEALVSDWRGRFGPDLPFAWVQLPEFDPQSESIRRGWTIVREQMQQALALPRTGMAVGLGLGDPRDIHPKKKRGIGERLARWALAEVYGHDEIPWTGPTPAGHVIEGGAIRVRFTGAAGGLASPDGDTVAGFALAGADRRWMPARGVIAGDSVVVSSPAVPEPVAVRYAWDANPPLGLGDAAGLPAAPFRTDAWDEPQVPPLERVAKPPVVAPVRAAGRPAGRLAIDGRLDDEFWRDLPAHSLVDLAGGGAPPQPTRFRIAFDDDDHVCLAVECDEPDAGGIMSTATGPGYGNIWLGDCVEFMLETDLHRYYQFTVNPAGALVDLDRAEGVEPLWHSGAEAACHAAADRWTAELRIPVHAPGVAGTSPYAGVIGHRPDGERPWFFNVCRQRVRGDGDTASAFAPGGAGGFHELANFARLVAEPLPAQRGETFDSRRDGR